MVLLQVMRASAELDETAIGQAGGEFPCLLRRDQRAGIAGEQQLRIGRGAQCGVVGGADGMDIGGLAGDRQFARQAQDRPARGRRREGLAIGLHLLRRQLAQHRTRQDALDEDVVLEDQLFALPGRAEGFEQFARLRALMEAFPIGEGPDELHEGEAEHALRPAGGVVEGESRAPVLGEDDEAIEPERRDEGVEIVDLVGEAIGDVGLAGLTVADQVGRDAARHRRDPRDDVAPDMRGSGVAVQQQHGRPLHAGFEIGHGRIEDRNLVAGDGDRCL